MGKYTKKEVFKEIINWIVDIGIAIVIALFITKFIITHTYIPTGSMIPTIEIDDHLIINRVPLYFKNPKAGEIVIFHNDKELIKRVIAVPGDTLDIRDGKVYVNGEELDEPYLNEPDSTYVFMMEEDVFPIEIPEDRYFLMGDNRNNSEDSRHFGMIHRKAIYAKSGFRIWPLNRIGRVK
ncbi:MAG: signal peptidase I [Epulopiscium sp.]|nr:signal peptidase I [Candidatus Epulonipiscium sp.]